MGHNDESDPSKGDRYADRGVLPGLGEEKKRLNAGNGPAVVFTFGHYLRTMIANITSAGAIPILSGPVPRNYWTEKKTLQSSWPFSDYAQQQAKQSGIEFLDHTHYSVRALQGLGFEKAGKLFPNDRTHTGDVGARLNAETFVQAIKCGSSQLLQYLNDKGKAIATSC
jgi:rhamnogalacturonan acetylesterase